MNCEVCGRKSENRFCELHEGAYENLLKNFEVWKRAMQVSWIEYLAKIQNSEFAGLWVKEVARCLLTLGHAEESIGETEL